METRFLRTLIIGLVLVGVLGGCATTVGRQEMVGLVSAENPEYMAHPLRMLALGMNLGGTAVHYLTMEPFYFLMSTVPDLVGLTLEERRHLEQRQEAWRQFIMGERRLVE